MSNNQGGLPQYINPQHTEKMYHDHPFEQCYTTPRMSNGLPSPCLTTPSSLTRGVTMDSTDDSPTMTDNSPASSMGSSGFITPSSLSNASSRRHSLIIPDSQQCFLTSANQDQTSPTPGPRRSSVRHHVEHLQSPLTSYFSSYSESLSSTPRSIGNGSFDSGVSSDEILGIDMFQNKPNAIHWQGAMTVNGHGSSFDEGMQMPAQCLSVDLAPAFNASIAISHMESPRQANGHFQMSNIHSSAGRDRYINDIIPSQVQYTHLPTLEEPFEPKPHLSDRSILLPGPSPYNSRQRKRSSLSTRRHKPLKKEEATLIYPLSSLKNHHKCSGCETRFKRLEHLKRHERVHLPREEANELVCLFYPACKRKIKDRSDNMRAHLQTTHFKYGKSERGAKNIRFSMKESMKMNLRSEDVRWALLLEGDIRFGDVDNRYYRMLGYSIKETKDIKVKDLIPEWEGADDTTLEKFDPRWIKLLEGNMTFEQAMETGRFMPETEKEGILGIDMMTSKEMGLQDLDPRWKKLLDGSMSVEESEKLGVKHLNASTVEKQTVQAKSRL